MIVVTSCLGRSSGASACNLEVENAKPSNLDLQEDGDDEVRGSVESDEAIAVTDEAIP